MVASGWDFGKRKKVKSLVRLNPAYRIYYTDSARQGGNHQVKTNIFLAKNFSFGFWIFLQVLDMETWSLDLDEANEKVRQKSNFIQRGNI